MAPPPPMLMEELEEEVLLRFPPHEPALLFKAALVCKRWRRLVCGSAFRRRFRELPRTPPMLGFVCNIHDDAGTTRFITSNRFCSPDADLGRYRAIDARHGRVLLQRLGTPDDALVLWDPIADERRELPLPPRFTSKGFLWTAAVLCDADGACNHLDCHRGPFLVVLLASGSGKAFICTCSSGAGTWSDPIAMEQSTDYVSLTPSVLVRNALYFSLVGSEALLKYDLESHEMSVIGLPFSKLLWRHVALDGELGLATVRWSKLCLWRKSGPEGDAGWTQNRVIELERLLPRKAISTSPSVVGFAAGIDVIFLRAGLMLFTIDLKTCEVKKVCQGNNVYSAIPYMSFYTPALRATCTEEGSSVCASDQAH